MPPFDWQLANDTGQRAQIIDESARLEFFVKRGTAGVLAERILTLPQSFRLEIKHNVSPARQLEDVRIELQCEKTKQKFLDQPLTQSPSIYSVYQRPNDCKYVRLSLFARAWTDKSDIDGLIHYIVINP